MEFFIFFWVYDTASRVLSRVPSHTLIINNDDVIFDHLPTGLELIKAETMMTNMRAALQPFSIN